MFNGGLFIHLFIHGGLMFKPLSVFSPEGSIHTQMHKLGTFPTKFQAVQEKNITLTPPPPYGLIPNGVLCKCKRALEPFNISE